MATNVDERIQLVDPRSMHAQPPFDQQSKFDVPGSTAQMSPRPDHGEQSYQGSGKLRGLSALITGGDSGIGRAVAICYAREGANVAINYLCENDDAEQTAELVQQAGVRAELIRGDVRDESFCADLIEQSVSKFGGLDILVNNAAYQQTRDEIDDFSTEVFDRVFKTNVYGTFWLSRAAMKHLPPGGSIVNTVSIQSFQPAGYLLPYAASKSALAGMTKAMAELAIKEGVRVNAVAPGPVWTPLIPSTMPAEKLEEFGGNTLLKRPAQPSELAPLYVWLASPEASYVTGEIFGCTGGRTPL
ncbi:MAG: SDR family oxidoreductase [Phycisphaera sp. RhM]|nr:SDR family oxidoreductase [Phycisphaera sp. RhM]